MLTTMPTPEMINEWKRVFEECHLSMSANRKTGSEINAYFRSKYPFKEFDDEEFKRIVELNITENEHSRLKLPGGAKPDVYCYRVGDVLVGIDSVSGEFHVECADLDKAAMIYDDLFVFRGLDEEDLKNFFLVAQYVTLTRQ